MAWNPHNSEDLFSSDQQQTSQGHLFALPDMRTRSHQRASLGLNTTSNLTGPSNLPSGPSSHHQQLQHSGGDSIPEADESYENLALSPVTSASASSPHLPHLPPSTSNPHRIRAATVSLANTGNTPPNRPRASTLSSFDPSTTSPSGLPSPSAGPGPMTTSATSSNNPVQPRRKRSRVTVEQLAYLERVFLIDRSPGAARRKEISELLGMQERQTQIWFQNRRAKAKMLESRRGGGPRGSPFNSPMSHLEHGGASDSDLQALIRAGEHITPISCTDLTVGSWHRIAAKTGSYDLIAYTAEGSRVLTWYIYSEGYGFKMEIPFDSISRVDLTTSGLPSGQAQATVILSQRPQFYMEGYSTPDPSDSSGSATVRVWKQCSDWTEGMQATKVLKHEVIGSAPDLYRTFERFPGVRDPLPSPPRAGVVILEAAPPYPPPPVLPGSPASAASHGSGGYRSPSSLSFSTSQQHQMPQQPLIPQSSTSIRLSNPQPRRRPSFTGHHVGSASPATHHDEGSAAGYSTNSFLGDTSLDYISSGSYITHPSYSSYPIQPLAASVGSPPPAPGSSANPHHQHGQPMTDYSSVPISNVMTRPSFPAASQHFPAGSPMGTNTTSMYNSSSVLVSPFSGSAPQSHRDIGSGTVGYGAFGGGHPLVPTPPSTSSGEHRSSLGGAMGTHVRTPPPSYPPS